MKVILRTMFTLTNLWQEVKRSGMDEIGLYIKIDKRSGVFPECYRENVMAVNLATGQVRAFPGDAKVKQVNAEVNILE